MDDAHDEQQDWESLLDDDDWLLADAGSDDLPTDTDRLWEELALPDLVEETTRAVDAAVRGQGMNFEAGYVAARAAVDQGFERGTAIWRRSRDPRFAPIVDEIDARLNTQVEGLVALRDDVAARHDRFREEMQKVYSAAASERRQAAAARLSAMRAERTASFEASQRAAAARSTASDQAHRSFLGYIQG